MAKWVEQLGAGLVGAFLVSGASQTLTAQQTSPLGGISTLRTPAAPAELTLPVDQLKPQQIQTMQQRLADWPGLGRYRAENETLGPPTAGQARVVFFGDSITDNWGRHFGKFFPGLP